MAKGENNRGRTAILLLGGLALAGGAIALMSKGASAQPSGQKGKIIQTFDLSKVGSQLVLTGLGMNGSDLVGCDSHGNVYVFNGISNVVKSKINFPTLNFTGMTYYQGNAILSDLFADKIYVANLSSKQLITTFASPSAQGGVSGVTMKGNDLISADLYTKDIYTHRGITNVIKSKMALTFVPQDITTDGKDLIVSDRGSSTIQVMSGFTPIIKQSIAIPNNADAFGIVYTGGKIVVATNDYKLHIISWN